jgi:hypothetical protein
VSSPADPIERNAAIRDDVGELQSHNLDEERHRAREIADQEMTFEEIAYWNHCLPPELGW